MIIIVVISYMLLSLVQAITKNLNNIAQHIQRLSSCTYSMCHEGNQSLIT